MVVSGWRLYTIFLIVFVIVNQSNKLTKLFLVFLWCNGQNCVDLGLFDFGVILDQDKIKIIDVIMCPT